MVITRNDPGTWKVIATYVFSLQVPEMEEMKGYQHVQYQILVVTRLEQRNPVEI